MVKELKKKVDRKHLRVVKDSDVMETASQYDVASLESVKEDTQRKLSTDPDMLEIVRDLHLNLGPEDAFENFYNLSQIVTEQCVLNNNFSFSYTKNLFLIFYREYKITMDILTNI